MVPHVTTTHLLRSPIGLQVGDPTGTEATTVFEEVLFIGQSQGQTKPPFSLVMATLGGESQEQGLF